MYLDCYKIEGTINNDQNPCFNNEDTHPDFQEKLEFFKSQYLASKEVNAWLGLYKVMK